MNPEKCQFFKQELLYLVHRVTNHGVGTDPDKVANPPTGVQGGESKAGD